MRILGIDPGLRITGYGCVEGAGGDPQLVEAGVFRLGRPSEAGGSVAPISDRLAELDRDLRELIARVRPQAVGVEALFAHYKHPATAIAMAHARGVILLNIKAADLRLIELKPAEVKKFLTGSGQASKEQMQEAIRSRLRLAQRPEPPDVADALAIALCAAWRMAPVTPFRW